MSVLLAPSIGIHCITVHDARGRLQFDVCVGICCEFIAFVCLCVSLFLLLCFCSKFRARPQAGALTLVQWRLSRKQLLRRLGKTMEDVGHRGLQGLHFAISVVVGSLN